MLYLSGCVRSNLPAGVGVMLTPMMGNVVPDDRVWAADTGCFARPDLHDDDRYLTWLERNLDKAAMCLFATAPDVVGDGEATLAMAVPMLERIRDLGYPAALVAQDGMDRLLIPWDKFDVLFVGGTDAWKLTGPAFPLMAAARERGKWVHAGRCNSYGRLEIMRQQGAQSGDGTFVAFAPDQNVKRVETWIDKLQRQEGLPMWRGYAESGGEG